MKKGVLGGIAVAGLVAVAAIGFVVSGGDNTPCGRIEAWLCDNSSDLVCALAGFMQPDQTVCSEQLALMDEADSISAMLPHATTAVAKLVPRFEELSEVLFVAVPQARREAFIEAYRAADAAGRDTLIDRVKRDRTF